MAVGRELLQHRFLERALCSERNQKTQRRRFFNDCQKTYFTLDASILRCLGFGAGCARGRNVACRRFRKRGTNPNAGYGANARKHCDASGQPIDPDNAEPDSDDTVHGSRLKFHKPSELRQQHDAVYGKTEHDSWEPFGRSVRKFAGDARRFQWLSEQSGFAVDFG